MDAVLERMLYIEAHDRYLAVLNRRDELYPDGEPDVWGKMADMYKTFVEKEDAKLTWQTFEWELSQPYAFEPLWVRVIQRWRTKHGPR